MAFGKAIRNVKVILRTETFNERAVRIRNKGINNENRYKEIKKDADTGILFKIEKSDQNLNGSGRTLLVLHQGLVRSIGDGIAIVTAWRSIASIIRQP